MVHLIKVLFLHIGADTIKFYYASTLFYALRASSWTNCDRMARLQRHSMGRLFFTQILPKLLSSLGGIDDITNVIAEK